MPTAAPDEAAETWRTPEMSLAAYLMYEGHKLTDVEWFGRSCYFVFETTETLVFDAADFVGDKALVNPRRYNMIFGQLKNKVFDESPFPPPPRRSRRGAPQS